MKEQNNLFKMESLRELYKIGRGPSSSHTMGPEKACLTFKKENPNADEFRVILYGSLAKTGKGHGTDYVCKSSFEPTKCSIEFNLSDNEIPHPNTMELIAFCKGREISRRRVFSIGGGSIRFENSDVVTPKKIYPHGTFKEIAEYCECENIRLYQYVDRFEDAEFNDYMRKIWEQMKASISAGLQDEGILPGGLKVHKKAKQLIGMDNCEESPSAKENREVCAYAFAVSEQNASYGKIVTAPTCGAAGVLPAVLYYEANRYGLSDEGVINALKTGGLIGNLVKTNASISGAECGCQAEVGTACAMAAATLCELFSLGISKIEYAAEIAIEHHLGLTCDPVCGLVQIPCIERNAVAAMRAINAVSLAGFLSDTRKISLDKVIIAMKKTGMDLKHQYRETSEGGLAEVMEPHEF